MKRYEYIQGVSLTKNPMAARVLSNWVENNTKEEGETSETSSQNQNPCQSSYEVKTMLKILEIK